MLSKEIGGGAARLMTAACSQRRMRSRVPPLAAAAAAAALLADKAVALSQVASAAVRSEGGEKEIRGELVCFVDPDAHPHERSPTSSHHPKPRHL